MRQRGVKRERGESSRRRVARLSENTLFSSRFLPWIDPEFLALKHESRILGHSSSSRCGLSMMEQVRYRLCAVKPMENWPGSSLNHIQGWTTVRESYFCVLEQGPLDRSAPRAVYSKFTRAEPIPPFIVGEPRIMVWRSRVDVHAASLVFRGDDGTDYCRAHSSIMSENKCKRLAAFGRHSTCLVMTTMPPSLITMPPSLIQHTTKRSTPQLAF